MDNIIGGYFDKLLAKLSGVARADNISPMRFICLIDILGIILFDFEWVRKCEFIQFQLVTRGIIYLKKNVD